MAYEYFDLGKAMNQGADTQLKRAQLDGIMQGKQRQRQIADIAQRSTTTEQTPFTDYSRLEGEEPIPGLATETTRFDPEKNQKNLMDAGFAPESEKLHAALAKMGKADREKLNATATEIAQAMLLVKEAPEDKKEQTWNFVANTEMGRKYQFPQKYDPEQTPMLIDQTINDARTLTSAKGRSGSEKAKKIVNITKNDGTKTTIMQNVQDGSAMEWNPDTSAYDRPVAGNFVINNNPSYREPQTPNPGISSKEQEGRVAKYIKSNWPNDKPALSKEDRSNFNLAVSSRARKIQSVTRGDYDDALSQAFEEEMGKTETKVNKTLGIDALSSDETAYKPRGTTDKSPAVQNKRRSTDIKTYEPKTTEELRSLKLNPGDIIIWKGKRKVYRPK